MSSSDDLESSSDSGTPQYESAEEGLDQQYAQTRMDALALGTASPQFMAAPTTLSPSYVSGRVPTLNLERAIAVQYFRMLYDAGELIHTADKRIVLAFSTDEEYDLYQVTVHGSVMSDVEQCLQQMKTLLSKVLSAEGHTFTSLPSWTRENILALRGSTKLAIAQRRVGAVCRFGTHRNGQRSIHVEVAGPTASATQELISHLKEMRPRHATWILPTQLVSSGKLPGFDIFLEVECALADTLEAEVRVLVWGFDTEPEQARQALLNPPAAPANIFANVLHERLSLEIPSTPPSYAPPLEPPPLRRGPPSLAEHTAIATSTSPSDHLPVPAAPTLELGYVPPSFQKTISALTQGPEDKEVDTAHTGPGYFPVAAPTTHPLQDSEALHNLYSHRASYSFQDRECGVFYQAFERAFAQTLTHAFGVHVARMELGDELGSTKNGKAKSPQSVGASRRSSALRVCVYSNVYKDCQAAISYLNSTLCSTNLIRKIIYFPRADAVLYKKIFQAKDEQDRISKAEQERDATKRRLHLHVPPGTEVVQNPMYAGGFVNIRIKPPVNTHGLRRMTFPADVSVTVCGPVYTHAQQDSLDRCERAIKSIPPDPHFVAEMEVSSLNPHAKSITPKNAREQFVQQYGLIAIRIDETTRRSRHHSISSTTATTGSDSVSMSSAPSPVSVCTTGSGSGLAGLATIWAPSKRSLDRVMNLLEEGEREVVRMAQQKAEAQLHIQTSENGELDDYHTSELIPFVPDAPVPDPALNADVPLPPLSFAEQLCSPTPAVDAQGPRIVIKWPHPSLKFAILEQMPKRSLQHLISQFREKGVKITTPYRDKKDLNACMLVESADSSRDAKLLASRAAHAVRSYMQAIAGKLKAVHVLLTKHTMLLLAEKDLQELKAMQGLFGVHIIIEPEQQDLQECSYSFNMTAHKQKASRDLKTSTPQSSPTYALAIAHPPPQLFPAFHLDKAVAKKTASFREQGEPPSMDLSLQVPNRVSKKQITLEVSCSDSSRWSEMGVKALLVVLDVSAMHTLTQEEIKQLDKGVALVNSDAEQKHTLLRVRPAYAWDNSGQSDNLHSALLTGLLTADKLGLGSIAVIAPAFNSLLSTMTPDELKAATAATLLYFVHEEKVEHIQRIVCLEDAEEELEEETAAKSSVLSSRSQPSVPLQRTPNMLAQALILFAAELKESNVDIIDSYVAQQLTHKIQHMTHEKQRTEHKESDSDAETELTSHAGRSSTYITYSDMVVLNKQQKRSVLERHNSAVLKGLPNNLLNCVNALWALEHGKSVSSEICTGIK